MSFYFFTLFSTISHNLVNKKTRVIINQDYKSILYLKYSIFYDRKFDCKTKIYLLTCKKQQLKVKRKINLGQYARF